MLSPIVRSPFQRLSPLNHRLRGSFHLTAYCAKKSEMYEAVSTAAAENANYFQEDSTPSGTALFCGFKLLAKQCRDVGPLLEKIKKEAPKYDLDVETPGNGFRSFIAIFESLFKRCSFLCETVRKERGNMLFALRKRTYIEDLKSWNEMLVALLTFLEHLNTLIAWNEKDSNRCLFPSAAHSSQELLEKAKAIESYSFYGRHAAFQFCASVTPILRGLLTIMAAYSDYYFSKAPHLWRVAKSLFMGTTYTLDAEHRSRRIVITSQFATVDFCKSFWFLAESDLMKKVPDRACPAIRVNQVIMIPPEPMQLSSVTSRQPVDIPIPKAHGDPRPIQVRLLSAKGRPGMPGQNEYSESTVGDCLILHCHGGGFVAQSSQSHECYLRHWAVALDVPILSIDYSLAPEYPFPRQLQEILYVYAWVLRNPAVTGTTAKKIIFVGDSAGANLLLGMTLWASELDLPMPAGLFLAYVPLLVKFVPSPSRLLCLTDPLLPFGFMMRCLNAYAGQVSLLPDDLVGSDSEVDGSRHHLEQDIEAASEISTEKVKHPNTVLDAEQLDRLKAHSPTEELDLFRVSSSPLMSPYLASDAALRKLPPIRLLSVQLDPCLDDSVEFAKRCRRLGCDIHLDILPGLPHGFLNFALVSRDAKEGSKLCVKRIRELMTREPKLGARTRGRDSFSC